MDTYKQRQHDRLDRLTAVAHKLIEAGHEIAMINPAEIGSGVVFISEHTNPEAMFDNVEHDDDTPEFNHWKARIDGVDVHWCRERAEAVQQAAEVAA